MALRHSQSLPVGFVHSSSSGWMLPLHPTLLLIHHSSHGLSFPRPPLSPRYLDLFLMLLYVFLLILLLSIKHLTFHSVIGILWLLFAHALPPSIHLLSGASQHHHSHLPSSGHCQHAPWGCGMIFCSMALLVPLFPGDSCSDQPLSWSSAIAPHLGPASQRIPKRMAGAAPAAPAGAWQI